MPLPATALRTYTLAAAMSLALNLGAIGTFATFDTFRAGTRRDHARPRENAAPLVLSELSPMPRPAPATNPPEERDASQPDEPVQEPPPPEPPREDPMVKLGNPDAPDSDSRVWLGVSKDPKLGGGRLGNLDQAEFKRGLPGAPGETTSTSTSPTTPSTFEAQHPQSLASLNAQAPPQQSRHDEQPAPRVTANEPFALSIDTARDAASRFSRQLRESIQHASRPAPQGPDAHARDPLDKAPQPAPPAPLAAPRPTKPATSGNGGNGADRDSDAFITANRYDIRPGQPLSARGLSIKTVAPRWTTATRSRHAFRNPTVRVKFGRTGKVLWANYLPGKDAGHPDVSEPLRDAMLRWTAQGDELSTIPPEDPDAGVVLEFKVFLN